jgi:hypothetical protein
VLARRDGDAEQLARAALGLGSGLGGFEVQPLDPVQVELLEEALHVLGPEPSRLRAWVLARLSVALSFLEAESRRRSLSEEAVTVARTVGDPSALGYALAGHCDAIAGPDWCDVRLTESAEVVRLAQETRDRQLELLGRRLHLVAALEVGDVGEADAELERFARVAEQLRRPLYRWYVPLWRGMRALMHGELPVSARHCATAEEIGAMAHSANATVLTFTQWWVRQRYEGRFEEAGTAMVEVLGRDVPVSLFTAGSRAVAALQIGDRDGALVLLDRWLAAGLHERTRDSEWLPWPSEPGRSPRCCTRSCSPTHTASASRASAPRSPDRWRGTWRCSPASWAPGRGRAYDAQARAAHRRVGLVGGPPPLAGVDGSGRRPPAAATPPVAASMRREGVTWAVTYAGTTRRLRDSKGLQDLAVLLAHPGREVHCLELVGGADVGSEAGPALDERARRAYQDRIRDLQEDIDEARQANDPLRAERAEAEVDALVRQLSEAFGLSGRARATGSAAERARSAVSWRLRAALRHVTEVHPELARLCRTPCGPAPGARTGRSVRWPGRSTRIRGSGRSGGRTMPRLSETRTRGPRRDRPADEAGSELSAGSPGAGWTVVSRSFTCSARSERENAWVVGRHRGWKRHRARAGSAREPGARDRAPRRRPGSTARRFPPGSVRHPVPHHRSAYR